MNGKIRIYLFFKDFQDSSLFSGEGKKLGLLNEGVRRQVLEGMADGTQFWEKMEEKSSQSNRLALEVRKDMREKEIIKHECCYI